MVALGVLGPGCCVWYSCGRWVWIIPACPPLGKVVVAPNYGTRCWGFAGLVLFDVPWNQAPSVGWGTPYVCVLLVLGLLCFTAFFFIERKVDRPLVPLDALSGRAGFVLGVCRWAGRASASGITAFGRFRRCFRKSRLCMQRRRWSRLLSLGFARRSRWACCWA